jgi:hypothetical protein
MSESWSEIFFFKLSHNIKSRNVKGILNSIITGDLLMWQSAVMIFARTRLEGRMVCEKWFFYNLPWHFHRSHRYLLFFSCVKNWKWLLFSFMIVPREWEGSLKILCDFHIQINANIFLLEYFDLFSSHSFCYLILLLVRLAWQCLNIIWLRVERILLILKCPSEEL